MKKLVTIVAMVLMAVSAYAQRGQVIEVDQSAKEPEPSEADDLKLIAEKDWTKETDYFWWEMFDNTEWERWSWITSHWNRTMTISSACS